VERISRHKNRDRFGFEGDSGGAGKHFSCTLIVDMRKGYLRDKLESSRSKTNGFRKVIWNSKCSFCTTKRVPLLLEARLGLYRNGSVATTNRFPVRPSSSCNNEMLFSTGSRTNGNLLISSFLCLSHEEMRHLRGQFDCHDRSSGPVLNSTRVTPSLGCCQCPGGAGVQLILIRCCHHRM